MINIVENVAKCPYCKIYITFDKEDVQKGEYEYSVYGCEINTEEYECVTCPQCGRKIAIF